MFLKRRQNQLEKLGYVRSADWWLQLRELRNQITHNYSNNEQQVCVNISLLMHKSVELLNFWPEFKTKVASLIS